MPPPQARTKYEEPLRNSIKQPMTTLVGMLGTLSRPGSQYIK